MCHRAIISLAKFWYEMPWTWNRSKTKSKCQTHTSRPTDRQAITRHAPTRLTIKTVSCFVRTLVSGIAVGQAQGFGLTENLLLVRKSSSRTGKFKAKNPHFEENYVAKLKFWAPTIFSDWNLIAAVWQNSVQNFQCQSENCNFLPDYVCNPQWC